MEAWKQAVDATIAWAEYIRNNNNEWAGYLKALCLNNWIFKCNCHTIEEASQEVIL